MVPLVGNLYGILKNKIQGFLNVYDGFQIEAESILIENILIQEFGRTFGQKLWKSQSYINSKASTLESPQTIQEYYGSFPEFLNDFFFGVIDELCQKKMTVCN